MNLKHALLVVLALTTTLTLAAKDIKTLVVTTTPQMHCGGCETKIKSNLRFEKGVKDIATDLERQTVTITYDADKTTAAALVQSFGKFGYEARPVAAEADKAVAPKKEAKPAEGRKAASAKRQ